MKRIFVFSLVAMMLLSAAFISTGHIKVPVDEQDGVRGSTPQPKGAQDIAKARGVIRINSNSEFTSGNGVTNGTGTKSDPYIIEEFNIYGKKHGFCIFIGNTTDYFEVRNCTLWNASGNANDYYWNSGIVLYNVKNGYVHNLNITGSEKGVTLYDSFENIIDNNDIHSCHDRGVWTYNSYLCRISNNTIENKYYSYIGNPGFEKGFAIFPWVSAGGNVGASTKSHNVRSGSWGMNMSNNPSLLQNNIPCLPNTVYLLKYYTKIASSGFIVIPAGTITFWAKIDGVSIYSDKHAVTGDSWYPDEVTFTTPNKNKINLSIGHSGANAIAYDDFSLQAVGSSTSSDIYSLSSNNNTFENNLGFHNDYGANHELFYGMHLYDSQYSLVYNSSFNNKFRAFYGVFGNDNVFRKNTATGGSYGFHLFTTVRYLIDNNTMSGGDQRGIQATFGGYNDILRNDISYYDRSGMLISSSLSNNISFNTIDSNLEDGIFLANSDYCTVKSNDLIENSYNGLKYTGSDHLLVKDNLCLKNLQNGIVASASHYTDIISNNCTDNSFDGIYLGSSDNAEISKNNIRSNAMEGVYVSSGLDIWVHRNTIRDNNIGVAIYSCDTSNISVNTMIKNGIGTLLSSADQVLFQENKVESNSLEGLFIDSSTYVEIKENSFILNKFQAFKVQGTNPTDSHHIFTHHNNFNRNNGNKAQVSDNCTNNEYNTTTQGNWWSDWTTPDTNWDGIVDNPYSIAGPSGFKDFYPLTKPWGKLCIINPDNKSAIEDLPYANDYDLLHVPDLSDLGIGSDSLKWAVGTNAGFGLAINDNGVLSGNPGNDDVGTYWVNVSVTKGPLLDFRNFTLNVINVNDAPVIMTTDVIWATEDVLYSVDYEAIDIDPDGDIPFEWTLDTQADFLSIDHEGILSGTPANEDVGSHYVNVSVADNHGARDFSNFTLTVNNTNDPPVIVTTPKLIAMEDAFYWCDFDAVDVDKEDTLGWALDKAPAFLSLNDQGNLTGTPRNEHVGAHDIRIRAFDSVMATAYSNFSLMVLNVNDPPEIITNDTTSTKEDQLYSVNYEAVDIDPSGDVLEWSLRTNARFLSIETDSGLLSGTPRNVHVGIPYWVNVSVSDGNSGRDWSNFTLIVTNTNDPPVWTQTPVDRIIEDTDSYSFNATAEDEDGDQIVYGIGSEPDSSVSIDPASGLITFDPRASGTFTFNLTASDGTVSIFHIFVITVNHLNTPPSVTLEKPKDKAELDVLNPTFIWTVTDPDSEDIVYDFYISENKDDVLNLVTASKVGSTLDEKHFTPPAAFEKGGTYYWTVIPFDGIAKGPCESGVWSFSIKSTARINKPPAFISTPPTTGLVDREWLYEPVATDDDEGDVVSIILLNGPKGMGLEGGVLKWTPDAGQLGQNAVSLEATDGMSSDFQDFFILVGQTSGGENTAPTVEKPGTVTVKEGDVVSLTLTANDPDGDPLTFRLISTGLDGAWVTSDGEFRWQTKGGDAGSYDVQIGVSDGDIESIAGFTVVVEGDDEKEDTLLSNYWWLLLILLIIIIIAVIAVIIWMRRKRGEDEPVDDWDEDQQAFAPAPAPDVIEPEVEAVDIFQAKRDAKAQQQTIQDIGYSSAVPEMTAMPDMEMTAMPDMEMPVDEVPSIGKTDIKAWDLGDGDAETGIPAQFKPEPLMLPPATVFEIDQNSSLDLDEVFLMTNEGILLNHYINTESTRIDEDILTGMLTAIQSFIKDSMKKSSDLKQLKLGDFNIVIEKGKLISAVAFTNSEDIKVLSSQIVPMIDEIEENEGEALRAWDGNMDIVQNLNGYITKLMAGDYQK